MYFRSSRQHKKNFIEHCEATLQTEQIDKDLNVTFTKTNVTLILLLAR